MILVSACLAGCPCRYDGQACPHAQIVELVNKGEALALCPEQLGGRPTPRVSNEIRSQPDGSRKVFGKDGSDQTEIFTLAAERTLAVCQALGITHAILKSNSPSCGCGVIYDGTFTGQKIAGDGITTALLKAHGIVVLADTDLLPPLPPP